MVVVYCTAANVASYCNITDSGGDRAVFGTDPPIPTQAEVEDLINIAEEMIEDKIKTAFGTRNITITEEYHDVYTDWKETSIHLSKCDIVTLASGSGDKLEVWNGSSWVDWLTTKTEGRNDDYWVDYSLGKIIFMNSKPNYKHRGVRVTYRVNSNTTVPKPISLATALQVGILLANSEHASVIFPEGESENNPAESRIKRWKTQIQDILKKYDNSQLTPDSSFIPVY